MTTALIERHRLATTGGGDITKTVDVMYAARFEPFDTDGYPFRQYLGDLTSGAWTTLREQSPASLVPVNPYEPSRYRQGKPSVWDAVVGIGPSSIRPRKLVDVNRIVPQRGCNQLWQNEILRGLNRVGPFGSDGEFVRPSGPYVLDLTCHRLGWYILEAAHILAHRRNEIQLDKAFRAAVAEVAVCYMFGLPIDTTGKLRGCSQYGIRIETGPDIRAPNMLVPWDGPDALVPDKDIAVVQVGTWIEPVPAGVLHEYDAWLECNRWTCMPTIIAVAGWECVDVLSHQPIGLLNPRAEKSPIVYAMGVLDLMPTDALNDLLAAAHATRGVPVMDERFRLVEEWVTSPDFVKAMRTTPPFPCKECMGYNRKTEQAPKKPGGLWRKAEEDTAEQARQRTEWLRIEKRLLGIATAATLFHEGSLYGGQSNARRFRAERSTGYRKLIGMRKQIRSLKRRIDRARTNGLLSKAHEYRTKLETAEHELERLMT